MRVTGNAMSSAGEAPPCQLSAPDLAEPVAKAGNRARSVRKIFHRTARVAAFPPAARSVLRGAGVGVLGRVVGGLGGGVVAETDSDGLVVAAALGVDQIAQQ